MSERNVELTRLLAAAYNARDVETVIAYCDPSIEFHAAIAAIGGAYRGLDGMREYFRDVQDAWAGELRVEPEAYFDFGDQTLVFHSLHGRGRHSGVEVAIPVALLARWREGLLVHLHAYAHREDALRELGVPEDELKPIDP
jgi:ketosteroid isomerase-like protein